MLRDSKGRFCKANKELNTKVKSNKIPFLSKKHTKDEENVEEWSDLGNGLNLDEIDEPIIIRVKIKEKDRFDDCVNNACIFDRLDWDERAKFMSYLFNDTVSEESYICENIDCFNNSTHCDNCFEEWFFNMYTPEVFHKILGD